MIAKNIRDAAYDLLNYILQNSKLDDGSISPGFSFSCNKEQVINDMKATEESLRQSLFYIRGLNVSVSQLNNDGEIQVKGIKNDAINWAADYIK